MNKRDRFEMDAELNKKAEERIRRAAERGVVFVPPVRPEGKLVGDGEPGT